MGPCFRRDDPEWSAPRSPALNSFTFQTARSPQATALRSRRVFRARFANGRLLKSEGTGKTGCALHPRSRVRVCKQECAHEHTGTAENTRPSLSNGFTAYNALSPVTGLSCHRHPREVLLPANLTPASGCQAHTASPSARVTLVSRNFRVHRISPHVRDDSRSAPLLGETRGAIVLICPTG